MSRKYLIPTLLVLIALSVPGVSLAQNGGLPVPPGRIIVGDENGLYTIQADGSDKTYLIQEADPDCWLRDGAWSLDGTQIMYTSICGGASPTDWRPDENRSDLKERTANVYLYDLASGESQELIPPETGRQDYAGDWHPDGKEVVIYSDRNENEMFNFYLVDLETGALTQITNFDSNASRVSFDPTGRFLLYNRRIVEASNIHFEVRAFDLTTENEIRVAIGVTPNWSPDGKWITYATENEPADVFIMPADCIYNGGGCNAANDARNITYTPDIIEREPVFSPDQTQIIYLRNTSLDPGVIMWDLYRQDLRTGLLQNLTDTPNISERERGWERIAAVSRVEVVDALPVLVRVNTGQGAANLREEPNTNSNIVGQAFNGQIVFVQGRSTDGNWYRITLPEDGSQAWLFSNLTTNVSGDPATTPIVER
jgi:dipeptidyl aminopeptidase/acylaminoacyl peptidase